MQELVTFLGQHLPLTLCALGLAFCLIIVEALRSKRNNFNINPSQLTQLINKQNAAIIDIRHIDVFRTGHIIGSQPLSAGDIQKNPKKLEKFRTRPLVIVSSSPAESQKIAQSLLKQGYQAYSLLGGIKAWHEAQMPLVKESK